MQAVLGTNSKTIVACLLTWLAIGGSAFAEEQTAAIASVEGSAEGEATEDAASVAEAEAAADPDAESPAKNGLFLEGLGPGLLYSLNYERVLIDDIAVRIGFSYWSVTATATSGSATAEASASFFTVPMTVTYVGLRGLEVGGGMTLLHTSGSGSTLGASASGSGFSPLGTLLVGYRSHPIGGAGFQFRVGGMAMMGEGLSLSANDPTSFGVLPWLYLSAGAGF
jgi:hypothetical protein